MRRTIIDSDKTRWKNHGGGSFHANIGGKIKIIKPGEVFMASAYEIPEAFRDVIRPVASVEPQATIKQPIPKPKPVAEVKKEEIPAPVDPVVEEETPAPVDPVVEEEIPATLKYSVVPRSAGYWNVVDKDGKLMNEKALRASAAEELVKSLEE